MAKDINNNFKEKESKTDIAYRLMLRKKKEKSFYELWEEVKKEYATINNLSEEEIKALDEEISFFYTNITLDGRFINVGDNKWNLRDRVPFDKIHIDMNDVYADEEQEVDEELDNDEDDKDYEDDYEDSYDDSTGSDADIRHYSEVASSDDDEE